MEQKKEIKISLNFVIVLAIIIILTVLSLIICLKIRENNLKDTRKEVAINTNQNTETNEEKKLADDRKEEKYSTNYYIDTYNGKDYYILNNDYSKECDIQLKDLYEITNSDEFEIKKCVNYSEYKEFCNKWDLKQKYNDKNMNYIMFSYILRGSPNIEVRLADVEYNGDNVKLYIWDDSYGITADVRAYIIIIPTKKSINNIEIQSLYSKAEFNSMTNKYKVTGYQYTIEDNIQIAKMCQISTKDKKLNEIVNNMLDAIVKKHTIKIVHEYKDDSGITYIDLINSASKITDTNGRIWFYETYTDMETITYRSLYDTNSFEKDISNDTREYLFKNITEFDELLDYEVSTYKLNEDNDNYIIEVKHREEQTNYYISKNNYLLNKILYPKSSEEQAIVTYTEDEVKIPSEVTSSSQESFVALKPIIYLYPQEEKEITVKLGYSEKITCSYPKYTLEGWKVIAKPDGSMIDLKTGRNLYSLYWEGKDAPKTDLKEGFVVKGEDAASFLEEKLEILGLSEREAEEFIIYWLPKLEASKYNYVRFATMEEINEYMPLEFSVNPDSLIRVLMQFKGLEEEITVNEQKLQTPKREGFIAVEWGGTELK